MAKKSDKQIHTPVSPGDAVKEYMASHAAAGRILELRGSPDRRAAGGSWFTPMDIAAELTAKALRYLPSGKELQILDPACGSGVFAAAVQSYPQYTFTGMDIDPDAVNFCRKYFPAPQNTFHTCDTLLARHPDKKFDLIIGNPPFVALPNIPAERRQMLRERYSLARGRFNLWALFIEWTLDNLAPGGIGALILPDRLWRNTGDENVRNYLERNSCILEYGEYPAGTFADAVVDSGYIIFSAGGCTPPEKRLCNALALNDDIYNAISSKSLPLGEILDIRDGIIPGHHAKEIFCDGDQQTALPATHKKLLTGRDVFPQKIIFRNRYVDYRPWLWRQSEDRGIRFRKPEIFETPKILTRQTSDSIIAAWDNTGEYYYANTLHGGKLKNNEYSGEFLAAYLSGPIANYCYRKLTGETGRPFAQVKITLLRTVPVLQLTNTEQELLLRNMEKIFDFAGIDKREIIA